jgi:uncharacterized membrane protein YdjX (TVP38/TMEM64 family)
MPPEEPRERRKLPLVKLSLGVAVLAAVAFFALRGVNYVDLAQRVLAYIRDAGPWAFFSVTAVAPAFGAPLSAFSLTAGEAFGRQMTMPGVVAAVLAAVAVNLAFTYWLARYALRPILSRVTERYGYTIPRVTPGNALSITLVLRLTPGPPYFMQSYILGLAEVPFRLYMVVSFLCTIPWAVAFVVLGKGIFNGNFQLVLYGVGVIVVASVCVHWIRKRYAAPAA